ncbi:DCC1-like thiol-disulfide oxidoreductase family protein [Pelagicoccus sp. SDUM812003]|uniref:thiol-disulfide oxidoreductase DCC family protein n=1 Tax=Pelagicoccus sp. SDUM812003 TaxID=3041267 RepID=UPI0028102733|nr:DCC1-like thiol-disulfide oxidoreductase family protein [Pelagicoccus sp. SDUM812003]MDQ8204006.1 DCC1-like thiol-disulfide oxidoreductase family protein [Pelagicoccus sp. SDUM812003]
MISAAKTDKPPPRPLLVWDGDCSFCKRCVQKWRGWGRPRVDDCPYQSGHLPPSPLSEKEFSQRIYLFDTEGEIHSGAAAAFRSLSHTRIGFLDRWYRRFAWFATISEWCYAFVARHRNVFSKIV